MKEGTVLVLGRLREDEEEEGAVLSRLVRKATGSGRWATVMKWGPFGNKTSSVDVGAWLLVETDEVWPCETCLLTEFCDGAGASVECGVIVGDDTIGVDGEVWVGEGCVVCVVVGEVTWAWPREAIVGAVVVRLF